MKHAQIAKDPLFHILLAGLVIYGLYLALRGAPADEDAIVVDEDALVGFIVKRTAATDVDSATARLNAMTPDAIDALAADYVREQALLKEALRLGLDQDDYVMERRLVQRLEFALLALARSEMSLSDDALAAFFQANEHRYREPAHITFTHVFLNPETRGDSIDEVAERILRELKDARVEFSDALHFGDRFLYHRNYVERALDDVASHFGNGMAEAVFALAKGHHGAFEWSGPFASDHGLHLVLVREFKDARTPSLAELGPTLRRDYTREAERNALEVLVRRIIDRQRVRIELPNKR